MAYISFQPSAHFNTKLYTGNASTNAITGVGFQPDFTWIKDKASGYSHMWFDAVRGVTKRIRSNSAVAEATIADTLTAFDSDGFTLGADSSSTEVNRSGANYISWNWKANGAGSSNTDGTINTTSTSVNTTAGISIIKYVGNGTDEATIGHGLGVAPEYLITKNLSTASWYVGSSALNDWDNKIYLDTNDAQSTNSPPVFGGASPTSSVINLGDDTPTNANGANYIMYAFAKKTGFSNFGRYEGSGDTAGPFIYTGFKPAWFMVKKISNSGEDWRVYDNKNLGYNPSNSHMIANQTNAITNNTALDLLSNGIKINSSNGGLNTSGHVYMWLAFAAEPLVASNGTPATAR